MAAAAIPIVAGVVGAISPYVPEIVQFVEGLFGHSSTTNSKDGAAKMSTAVELLQTALNALANSGKLPSAGVVDPSLPAGLAGAVQQAFDSLKSSGQLGTVTAASASPVVKPATAAANGAFPVVIRGTMSGS